MALYHFKGDLKNFVIKIELRRLSPLFSLQNQQQNVSDNIYQPEFETWHFKWQEKVFSQCEEELYSDERYCFTPLAHNYHARIVEMRETGTRPNGRLFSYTDVDYFDDVTGVNSNILTDEKLNTRKMAKTRRTTSHSKPDTNPIINLPTKTEEKDEKMKMYVMSDLRRKEATKPDESVLCTVTLVEEGVVRVVPDFSERWVRMENSVGDNWEFRISNDSTPPTMRDVEREEHIVNELFERQNRSLSRAVGDGMFGRADLESDEAIYHILGEISCCHGFPTSSLYVSYKLDLSGAFELVSGEKEESFTNQASSPLSVWSIFSPNSLPPINIGHLFEYELKAPMKFSEVHTSHNPILLLEVNCLDWWNRHLSLGYGWLALKLAPGMSTKSVITWRLAPRSKWEELSEYFVGVSPALGKLDRVGLPLEFEDGVVSKLGWRSETSGHIEMRIQVIVQKSIHKNES